MERELLNLTEPDFQSNTDHPDRSITSIQEASFLLAQFYYELEQYRKAWKWYSKIQDVDLRGISLSLSLSLSQISFTSI